MIRTLIVTSKPVHDGVAGITTSKDWANDISMQSGYCEISLLCPTTSSAIPGGRSISPSAVYDIDVISDSDLGKAIADADTIHFYGGEGLPVRRTLSVAKKQRRTLVFITSKKMSFGDRIASIRCDLVLRENASHEERKTKLINAERQNTRHFGVDY